MCFDYVSVVRAGTQAAVGVSAADMNLRQMRERVKRRMLQNLNIFVSQTRLCINNLPENLTDGGLRKVFLAHGEPGCKLTEVSDFKNIFLFFLTIKCPRKIFVIYCNFYNEVTRDVC